MSGKRAPSHGMTLNEARRIAAETEYIPGLPDYSKEKFTTTGSIDTHTTVRYSDGNVVRAYDAARPLRPDPTSVCRPSESRFRRALRVLGSVSRA